LLVYGSNGYQEKEEKTYSEEAAKEIDKEIAELKEKTHELELKWKNEKELLVEIGVLKKELETARLEAEAAEVRSDLTNRRDHERVLPHRLARLGTMRLAGTRKQHAQRVVNLGNRSHRRTWVGRSRLLINRDRG